MLSPVSLGNSLPAIFALQRTQRSMDTVLARLSSGRRINSGKDDPAGLIASERLASEIRSLEAQNRSIQRADANARIAEGHAVEVSSMLIEMRGLVIASANTAGMSDAERAANQMQIDSLAVSITRFTNNAVDSLDGFNMPNDGNAIVEGQFVQAQAGAISLMSGGANDLASGNFAAADAALSAAITAVATGRGRIGGFQKDVLMPTLRSNGVALENLSESRSRIADTDFAVEMSNLNRNQILMAAGIKVLVLSQQQPRSVLALLGL